MKQQGIVAVNVLECRLSRRCSGLCFKSSVHQCRAWPGWLGSSAHLAPCLPARHAVESGYRLPAPSGAGKTTQQKLQR
eukprot:5687579-Amphidinium_carterae.3